MAQDGRLTSASDSALQRRRGRLVSAGCGPEEGMVEARTTVVGDGAIGSRASSDRETSIRRGIEVLAAASDRARHRARRARGHSIAETLGREKSQVRGRSKILAHYGLVDRVRHARLPAGWRIFALANLAGERRLLDGARPPLAHLVARLSERAHLSVLEGAETLTILSESPPQSLQAVGWVGRGVPAYATSVGKAP